MTLEFIKETIDLHSDPADLCAAISVVQLFSAIGREKAHGNSYPELEIFATAMLDLHMHPSTSIYDAVSAAFDFWTKGR